jgi:hypothetical protein
MSFNVLARISSWWRNLDRRGHVADPGCDLCYGTGIGAGGEICTCVQAR